MRGRRHPAEAGVQPPPKSRKRDKMKTKAILKYSYIAVYLVAAALLVWRYVFNGDNTVRIAAIAALIVGFVIQTTYNFKYKPRPGR